MESQEEGRLQGSVEHSEGSDKTGSWTVHAAFDGADS